MTPQETATQVYDFFYKRYEQTDSCFGLCNDRSICDGTGHGCGLWKIHAKDSAVFTIQQIISELEQLRKPEQTIFILNYQTYESTDGEQKLNYWNEVLTHLNKL